MTNFSQAVDLIIKAEMAGKPHHESILELGDTPEYLIRHGGFEQKDLVISGKVISKACFDHGVPTSMLKRLPDILHKPKSLFNSATHNNGSVVVVTFEVVNRVLPFVLPIHKNKRFGRARICNAITSAYGKQGDDPEQRWTRQGLLLRTF